MLHGVLPSDGFMSGSVSRGVFGAEDGGHRPCLTPGALCHTLYDMNENRVNARIDDATQERLNELILTTGQSVSHVVREAIAVYHVQMRKGRPLPTSLLSMVGKGRSKDGRTDVSVNYKNLYAQALEEKYALAHPPAKKKKTKR